MVIKWGIQAKLDKRAVMPHSGTGYWAIMPDAAENAFGALREALLYEKQLQTSDNDPLIANLGPLRVIRVHGPMVSYELPEALCQMFGLCVTGRIQRRIEAADADSSVAKIVLDINSPGGMVTGITDLAAAIEACETPIASHASGICASAAYWTAAATDRISTDPTAAMGSVGVVMVQYKDDEEKLETVSSQTPKKRGDVFAEDKEERKAARAEAQRIVDDLAAEFISYIEKRRGDHGDAADGRVEIGEKAVEAGFADVVYLRHQALAYSKRKKMKESELTAREHEVEDSNRDAVERPTPDLPEPDSVRVDAIIALKGPADLTVEAISKGWTAEESAAKFIAHYKAEAKKKPKTPTAREYPIEASSIVAEDDWETEAKSVVDLYKRIRPNRVPQTTHMA